MTVYDYVKKFKEKYPATIAWRLEKNAEIVQKHLNPDETIRYAFAAQKNNNPFDIITTCVVAITDKRMIIGQKRVLFGYFCYSITPDLYNDMQVRKGLFWGNIIIDTIKEVVTLSDISPKALIEIETEITQFMMEAKQKYKSRDNNTEIN